MIRSLYTGISGLRNHQIRMDVVSNNIANVNTTGFKAGRVNFQDVLAQTVGTTGINPAQVGLGITLGGIDTLHTQGGLQNTGRSLDLAIEGNGFFVLNTKNDASGKYTYTRDGTFYVSGDGYLVTAQGQYVMGSDGTNNVAINLTQLDTDGDGTYTAADQKDWDGVAGVEDLPVQQIDSIQIDENGYVYINGYNVATGTGKIQISIANFANPMSLTKAGSNQFEHTPGLTKPDTETDAFGAPGTPGRGIIRSGYLEMSNVDLAQEFTNMITTQRGYQASARVITVSDSLLEELVQLKR
ncbi:MAG: flagellar hook-basal body complex protein [Peptococcaceae bacterium]|nr:flagellar hook-basal body complex protein [Peptococcaceae bacterium]